MPLCLHARMPICDYGYTYIYIRTLFKLLCIGIHIDYALLRRWGCEDRNSHIILRLHSV